MHPNADELKQYIDEMLPDAKQKALAEHINKCEFCTEFCENYKQLTTPIDNSIDDKIPDNLLKLAQKTFNQALRSKIIPLQLLVVDQSQSSEQRLAADGQSKNESEPDIMTTLCSENPEIVLRVSHSHDKDKRDKGYLQLMAEDDHLSAHVMVRIPELNKEFITDASGRADIDLDLTDNIEALKWEIKLPEAVFELQPLDYNPDKVEEFNEVILESDHNDRVVVRLEKRTEGKALSIKIEELSGESDFEPVTLAITQDNQSSTHSAKHGKLISIGKLNSESCICIRLYTK